MKPKILAIIAVLMLICCEKKTKVNSRDWQMISENVQMKDSENFLELKSGKFTYKIKHSELPFKRVMMLNASLIGYVSELHEEQKIIGVSSPEYIFSSKIHDLINTGKIQNIGNEQKYDVEKIIALKPDAVFTNYIASFENTYDLIRKNGIRIIFLDEYLEQDPLEKSKYLLVFGKLLGAADLAAEKYAEIEKNYKSLKKLALTSKEKPVVLANEMYGNQWFLPGGRTNLAHFIADANGSYINSDNTDSKAVPMSFEEVFSKSRDAEYWVNVGNHQSKKELLQINPNYANMNVYNHGGIYGVSAKEKGSSNDFFESGVVRADLVLKDYIKIFHPELLKRDQLTYMSALK
ncbi:ABC transporter substrate-binding protein [Chryseobacterium sp.]|uniref:ABC transporter substrate-binding protein n=1 Tax=Chryseobacterium sp. TaxID=1871047 RepID=UPI0011CB3359|nr:ABC transporter substrate-binding protein [Chryseobacterium sp.]TXF78876.1 ABC transporter substrate-binding protein [Chryseobacterium sp.]